MALKQIENRLLKCHLFTISFFFFPLYRNLVHTSKCNGVYCMLQLSWHMGHVWFFLALVSFSASKDNQCWLMLGAKWFWHWTLLSDVCMQVQHALPQSKVLFHHSQQIFLAKYRKKEILWLQPPIHPSRAMQGQILQILTHYKTNQLVSFRDSRKLLSSMEKSWFRCIFWLPPCGLDPFTMQPWSKLMWCCSAQYHC